MKKITVAQLENKLTETNVNILDVRAKDKYENQHITHPNAKSTNIPKTNIFNMNESGFSLPESFSKNEEIVVTCTTGNSATKCATILSEQGYNVSVLDGGITSWNKQK